METRSRSGLAERSSWSAQLPTTVAIEVQRRREEILAHANGRLLDLDEPGGLDRVIDAAAAPSGALPDADRFDTVVSTARLIDLADLPAAARGLRRLLAADGELHLVEPVNRPGTQGLVVSSVGALLPGVAGLHLGRDVVRTIRATGLTVVDLDRFTIPTPVWPLRRFVQLRAIWIESTRSAPTADETADQDAPT